MNKHDINEPNTLAKYVEREGKMMNGGLGTGMLETWVHITSS